MIGKTNNFKLKWWNILLFLIFIVGCNTTNNSEKYKFYINLNQVENDEIAVTLITPKIKTDKAVYNIPKIIPGSYENHNFGEYIHSFKAFDKNNDLLSVSRINSNQWEINDASRLAKITYVVADTWDSDKTEIIPEPEGTNIEKNQNFVINNHGFFGYFNQMKNYPYEINVTKPKDFFGSSSLSAQQLSENEDQFNTLNYFDLVDAPIMYCVPDTTIFEIDETIILISVYSENKVAKSEDFKKDIKEVIELQRNYMGFLPTEKYTFLIYLFSGESKSGGMGALEHSNSSFYYLPEMPAPDRKSVV